MSPVIAKYHHDQFVSTGRRITDNRSTDSPTSPGSSDSNLSYDAFGHVIEERSVWLTQSGPSNYVVEYLWSPDGKLLLRDVDSDASTTTHATGLPRGTDQRIFALDDGQGNITAITDASGTVLERYLYTPGE